MAIEQLDPEPEEAEWLPPFERWLDTVRLAQRGKPDLRDGDLYGAPRDKLFEPEGEDELDFLPAPDVEVIAARLIRDCEELAHLANDRISYLWKREGGKTDGQPTLGKCVNLYVKVCQAMRNLRSHLDGCSHLGYGRQFSPSVPVATNSRRDRLVTTCADGNQVALNTLMRDASVTGRAMMDFQPVPCAVLVTEPAPMAIQGESSGTLDGPSLRSDVLLVVHDSFALPNTQNPGHLAESQLAEGRGRLARCPGFYVRQNKRRLNDPQQVQYSKLAMVCQVSRNIP